MTTPRPRSPRSGGVRTVPLRFVGLYPPAWRRRYGAELEALLEQLPPTPSVAADLLAGALDAHAHAIVSRWRSRTMPQRLRSAEITVFAAWTLFVLAGLGFRKLTEDPPFTTAAASQPLLWVSFAAVVAGALLALLAVVAGGVPIAVAIARSLSRGRSRTPLALLAVPPVALLAWIGLAQVMLRLHGAGLERGEAFALLVAGLVAAAGASVAAVSAAAARADVEPGLYRFAMRPAIATAAAMALGSLGVLGWGVALLAGLPSAFWGNDGILASTTALTWGAIVVAMLVATLVAAAAAVRAVRSGASAA